MEIDVVARIWMEIRHERACVLVESSGRIFEDSLAFAITDNVVLLTSYG
jgi:hypothetical protein